MKKLIILLCGTILGFFVSLVFCKLPQIIIDPIQDFVPNTYKYFGRNNSKEVIKNFDSTYHINNKGLYTSIAIERKRLKYNGGIIELPGTAARIAIPIFLSKCGKEIVKSEVPFTVVKINDKVWKVTGRTNRISMYIQSADAKVLKIKID